MKPKIHIGWVSPSEIGEQTEAIFRRASELFQESLSRQFPAFSWEVDFAQRYRYTRRTPLNPLILLELGVQEKLQGSWDYAVVVVPNELQPRARTRTVGVPSSALETIVMSSAALRRFGRVDERLAALSLHLLGHIWGLGHHTHGLMAPPEDIAKLTLVDFERDEQRFVDAQLHEVADQRIEETDQPANRMLFYLRTFMADPDAIARDIIQYRPWRLPFQIGSLTAATAISLVVILMAAEAWEVGTNLTVDVLLGGFIFSVLSATLWIYFGQNLGSVSRDVGLSEQLARTRIVVFATLLLGMFSLWSVLFLVSYAISLILPQDVLIGWSGQGDFSADHRSRQSALMAIFGVLAGAFGGNLEEEDEIKAEIFYDEEA